VKKIIGILVALGLVLSLTVMATPVAAKVEGVTAKVFSTNCACSTGCYNITFNISASLTEGVGCVCIKFPAGTSVPATGTAWKDGDIKIAGVDVFGSEVTVTGTEVCFIPPAHLLPATDNPITVEFTSKAGIVNPCTAGKYQLEVKTCRAPDSTYVKSAKYTIVPCISEYGFVWDSGPTYAGIAEGFVPPFKACGQNFTNAVNIGNLTHPKFMNAFNLTFAADPVGCNSPCQSDVTLYLSLVASPQFPCADVDPVAKVTINLTGSCGTLNTTVLTYDECVDDEPEEIELATNITLTNNTTCNWEGLIHFDTVGEYTICFWAECPGALGAPCHPPAGDEAEKFAETCLDFDVYQWKDAGYMTLKEKWNLISLPLVPLEEGIPIEDVLASIPKADRDTILSIWYYDRCEDEWLVWGNGQSSLTTMEAGKAYWMRLAYPLPGCGNVIWWQWGTPKPVPPASPAAYPVCEGWNMVGFTSLASKAPSAYLWNWVVAPNPVVYGWSQNCWNLQTWSLIPWGGTPDMVPGQGYWIAFPADGAVYQP